MDPDHPIADPDPLHRLKPEAGEHVASVFLAILGVVWFLYSMHKAYLGYGSGNFVQRTLQNMFYCWALGPQYDIERQA